MVKEYCYECGAEKETYQIVDSEGNVVSTEKRCPNDIVENGHRGQT
jgi:hypothetical protein